MKALTIRDLPPSVVKELKKRATRKHLSYNKAVVSLLEETLTGKGRPHHDLDHLAGSWKKAEAARFDTWQRQQRKIDKDLWE